VSTASAALNLNSQPRETNQVFTNFVSKLNSLRSETELCHAITEQIRDLTGFIAFFFIASMRPDTAPSSASKTIGRFPAISTSDFQLQIFRSRLAHIDAVLEHGELANYYLAHSARADMYRRLGRTAEARASYEKALELTQQEPERQFLQERIRQLN
jgi:tetratricopeptide (TPR) repeat protein